MRSRWMICLFSSINLAPFFPQHPLFPRKILPPFKLYILFPTPIPTSNTSPITTSTPKMDRFHSVASIRAMTTFIGSIDFLDSQSSLLLVLNQQCFAFRNEEIIVARRRTQTITPVNCVFCDVVQLQYVRTASYDSCKMFADVSLALSSLKMVSQLKGKTISLTPDDLFSRFF